MPGHVLRRTGTSCSVHCARRSPTSAPVSEMTVSVVAASHGGLGAIERLCTSFSERIAFVGVLGMLSVAFITVGDVLMRWVFNHPIAGLNEIVVMGTAASVAATFPAGVMRRVNLNIE